MTPPDTLRAEVLARLPALGNKAWQPLKGGRTNRLWRVGDMVVKAYDPAQASPLFPNDAAAEARALTLLGPTGLSPRLTGAGTGWLAYAHVEGRPWQGDPAPVARALHRLHQHPAPGFRLAPTGSAALLAQGQAILADCQGTLPPPPPDPGVPPLQNPRLIHGDAVPGNLIEGPGGLILIDWQCPAAGDPAEDLATFASPAMQWLYRGSTLGAAETEAFLTACPDPTTRARHAALAPIFRWRMAAHCLWKAERGSADHARAIILELG